jgi:hypothetical protein
MFMQRLAVWHLAMIGAAILLLVAGGIPAIETFGDLPFNAMALVHGALAILATVAAGRARARPALAVILGIAVVLRLLRLFTVG